MIIAINSDTSVKNIKGKNRPVNKQDARVKILSSLNLCDHIIIFNQPTPLKLITSLKPHIITKGGDYEKEKVVGYKEINKWNGKIHIIKFTQGMSSTSIIKKLD